jgi:hypothetical protein
MVRQQQYCARVICDGASRISLAVEKIFAVKHNGDNTEQIKFTSPLSLGISFRNLYLVK